MDERAWIQVALWATTIILGGIYLGLQDRFGANIITGYREYRRQKAFWAKVNATDYSQYSDDKTPHPDLMHQTQERSQKDH